MRKEAGGARADAAGRPAGVVVGIDASRNRSGGAKAHLRGILSDSDPTRHGIATVHVWSYGSLLAALPERPWLVKHNPPALERSLVSQLLWQYRRLPIEARALQCEVLLNTDAGSIARFRPCVVMSRDMLSYEPGEMPRYGYSKARLRLEMLRHVQRRSLRRADGVIFLTRHAADVIGRHTGALPRTRIIPHGVSAAFRAVGASRVSRPAPAGPLRCLYVSNTAPYKHQWHVVRAFAALRRRGLPVSLRLVGGGSGPAQRRLEAELERSDPRREFVRCDPHTAPDALPAVLAEADLFVFASSCENMPNTLLEAMAAGLPIACSNRGPMPEVLADGGVYFDPEAPDSIAAAVERLAADPDLRRRCAERAFALSGAYSWTRCGDETWDFLKAIAVHSA